jgi:hypothetical protein
MRIVSPAELLPDTAVALDFLLPQCFTSTLTIAQERQVRSDCESERIKRSQIKKQMHTAKEKQKTLVKMGIPRPAPKKEQPPAAPTEPAAPPNEGEAAADANSGAVS